MREIKARLEQWRERLGWKKKGCGCLLTILVAGWALAGIGGAMIGDYFGPPEGAAEDARIKGMIIRLGLATIVLCVVTGSWLVSRSEA